MVARASRFEAGPQVSPRVIKEKVMETSIVELPKAFAQSRLLAGLIAIRTQCADDFIEQHASGTLRKNKRLGMAHRDQYLHERAAYEFGYAFECLPATRVTVGKAKTEGDCKPLTEVGWHCERYLARNVFPQDKFEVAYIQVDEGGHRREGVGLVVTQTSAGWIPHHHVVFAIIAEVDQKTHEYLPAINPF